MSYTSKLKEFDLSLRKLEDYSWNLIQAIRVFTYRQVFRNKILAHAQTNSIISDKTILFSQVAYKSVNCLNVKLESLSLE